MCVAKCEDFSYNYVSNRETGKCEYCGSTCTLCSAEYGCLFDYMLDHGFRSVSSTDADGNQVIDSYPEGIFPYSASAPTDSFNTIEACSDSRCDKCQDWDAEVDPDTGSKRCDSCYQYTTLYEPFR